MEHRAALGSVGVTVGDHGGDALSHQDEKGSTWVVLFYVVVFRAQGAPPPLGEGAFSLFFVNQFGVAVWLSVSTTTKRERERQREGGVQL